MAQTGKQLEEHPPKIIQKTMKINQAPVWPKGRHVQQLWVDMSGGSNRILYPRLHFANIPGVPEMPNTHIDRVPRDFAAKAPWVDQLHHQPPHQTQSSHTPGSTNEPSSNQGRNNYICNYDVHGKRIGKTVTVSL